MVCTDFIWLLKTSESEERIFSEKLTKMFLKSWCRHLHWTIAFYWNHKLYFQSSITLILKRISVGTKRLCHCYNNILDIKYILFSFLGASNSIGCYCLLSVRIPARSKSTNEGVVDLCHDRTVQVDGAADNYINIEVYLKV